CRCEERLMTAQQEARYREICAAASWLGGIEPGTHPIAAILDELTFLPSFFAAEELVDPERGWRLGFCHVRTHRRMQVPITDRAVHTADLVRAFGELVGGPELAAELRRQGDALIEEAKELRQFVAERQESRS